MKNHIHMPMKECYPTVRVVNCDDGDVLLCFDNYPINSSMAMTMTQAVELATQILCMANKQIKEAA